MSKSGRTALAVLVLGALLNVPLWALGSGAGPCGVEGGGGPPFEGGGNGAKNAPGPGGAPSGWRAAGQNARTTPVPCTISFPFEGGSDASFTVTPPAGCMVLNASLQLEGRPALPPPTERRYTPSSDPANCGWEGVTTDTPPSGGPSTFQQQKLESDAIADVSSNDANAHLTITYALGAPYHLFKFHLTEDNVTSITVKWVGCGWDVVTYWYESTVYIRHSTGWDTVGSVSGEGWGEDSYTLSKTFSTGNKNYIDAAKNVYVLVEGPYGFLFTCLETDYAELKVLGAYKAWPSELELDIGADGTPEYQLPGELRTNLSLGPEVLRGPLQRLLDAGSAGAGPLEVPFSFASRTGGILCVNSASFDFDTAPVYQPVPAEKACFDEDTAAAELLDLDLYFKDDRDARLSYEVAARPEDGRIAGAMDADGRHMSFNSTARDWYGTGQFAVKATDSSGLSTIGYFNVTVRPVNDPPALLGPGDQTVSEDQPFTMALRASDVDDPAANLSFSDDCPLFDIGPSSGVISFTPTNAHVGIHLVIVSVHDTHDAWSNVTFTLTVGNVNDAPVLDCKEGLQLFGVEHQLFAYRIRASDVDAGDAVSYSVESDMEDLKADPNTGEISLMLEQRHVGEHNLELVAADLSGAEDRCPAVLTVKNVNDPPVISAGETLNATEWEEFEYTIKASDPDAGDELTFSSDAAAFVVDPDKGRIRFTPGEQEVGRTKFRVVVTDRAGLSAEALFFLEVANVNDPPAAPAILSPAQGSVVTEGKDILLSATASDPDAGDVPVVSWYENGKLLGRGAKLSVRLPPGKHVITSVVSDGYLNSSAEVSIEVRKAAASSQLLSGPFQLGVMAAVLGAAGAAGALLFLRLKGRSLGANRRGHGPQAPPGQPSHGGSPAGMAAGSAAASHLSAVPPPAFGNDGNSMPAADLLAAYSRMPPSAPLPPPGLPGPGVTQGPVDRRPPGGSPPGRWELPVPPPQHPSPMAPSPPFGTIIPPGSLGETSDRPVGWSSPEQGMPGSVQVQCYPGQGAPPVTMGQYFQGQDTPAWMQGQYHQGQGTPAVMQGQYHQGQGTPAWMQGQYYQGQGPPGSLPRGYQGAARSPSAPAAPDTAFPGQMAGAGREAPQPDPRSLYDADTEPPEMSPPIAGREGGRWREGQGAPNAWVQPSGYDGGGHNGPGPAAYGHAGPERERPEEDSMVSRDAMRTAVADAKQAIQAARDAGLEPAECDNLLAEAIAASYRLDYVRARNQARRAEAVALLLLERSAGEGGAR